MDVSWNSFSNDSLLSALRWRLEGLLSGWAGGTEADDLRLEVRGSELPSDLVEA